MDTRKGRHMDARKVDSWTPEGPERVTHGRPKGRHMDPRRGDTWTPIGGDPETPDGVTHGRLMPICT